MLLEFKGELGENLSVLLFLTQGQHPHKEAAIAAVTVLDEMQSGVICGFLNAVFQIPPPQIIKSWLN